MNEQSTHEFDEYKDNYSPDINSKLAYTGQGHDFYLKLKADHLLDLIDDTFGVGKKVQVLDVGCGHGLMHPLLEVANIELSGCDPAASVVEEAKQSNPSVEYKSNDGHILPYPDDSFDVVFTVCVMHHVPPQQWLDFLAEMKRVTKSGGILAVYEHNPYNPLTAHLVRTCPIDENAVLLKAAELYGFMKEVGIQQARREYIIFFPFKQKIFRAIERLITWLPLGAQYAMYSRISKNCEA